MSSTPSFYFIRYKFASCGLSKKSCCTLLSSQLPLLRGKGAALCHRIKVNFGVKDFKTFTFKSSFSTQVCSTCFRSFFSFVICTQLRLCCAVNLHFFHILVSISFPCFYFFLFVANTYVTPSTILPPRFAPCTRIVSGWKHEMWCGS